MGGGARSDREGRKGKEEKKRKKSTHSFLSCSYFFRLCLRFNLQQYGIAASIFFPFIGFLLVPFFLSPSFDNSRLLSTPGSLINDTEQPFSTSVKFGRPPVTGLTNSRRLRPNGPPKKTLGSPRNNKATKHFGTRRPSLTERIKYLEFSSSSPPYHYCLSTGEKNKSTHPARDCGSIFVRKESNKKKNPSKPSSKDYNLSYNI